LIEETGFARRDASVGRGGEPTDLAIARVLTDFVPLSKTMAEQIAGLRNWAKGRARPAAAAVAVEPKLRRLAA
jgi:hypothetical protein